MEWENIHSILVIPGKEILPQIKLFGKFYKLKSILKRLRVVFLKMKNKTLI